MQGESLTSLEHARDDLEGSPSDSQPFARWLKRWVEFQEGKTEFIAICIVIRTHGTQPLIQSISRAT